MDLVSSNSPPQTHSNPRHAELNTKSGTTKNQSPQTHSIPRHAELYDQSGTYRDDTNQNNGVLNAKCIGSDSR
jgi:hypothetical protein